MCNEFDNECKTRGLTGGGLIKWLHDILSTLDNSKAYVIPQSVITALLSKSEGNVVTSVFPADTFNGIFEAIKSGDALKCKTADGVYFVTSATFNEVEADDYKSIEFEFIGTLSSFASTDNLKRLKFGLENLGGAIRLYEKALQKITTTNI